MKMISKSSKAYSVLCNKCPRCAKGDFFYSHPYNLKQFGNKHTNCTHCDLKFEREPGFFFGSMYISYSFGVALFVSWWLIKTLFFPEMQAGEMILIMLALQTLLAPLILYLSKLIWLNLFVKFEQEYS
tara:strand:+ start:1927 stop:2310 length:384 start_codon:yes stop_codon:yes gene_type:complete